MELLVDGGADPDIQNTRSLTYCILDLLHVLELQLQTPKFPPQTSDPFLDVWLFFMFR
jgi:hypothetical protein